MQFDSFLENVEKDDPRIRSLIEKLKLGDKESTALNKKRSLER